MRIWLLDATSTRSLEIGESPLLAFTTSAWRIRPEEVSRLAASQEKVRLSRIEGPRIKGECGDRDIARLYPGVLPTGPVYFSTYIKPAQNEDYGARPGHIFAIPMHGAE